MDFNNSRIQQYQTCRASYRHRYLRHVVSRKRASYFVLGEAIHKFIEFYYRTKDKNLALRQVKQIFAGVDRALMTREDVHDLECDMQIALGIAAAYPPFYKQDFDEFKTFLTEQKFSIPLVGGHNFFGTLDALLQDHAGDWWILETKTAAAQTVNDDYFERVKIDTQVAGYMHGAKHLLGVFPRGILYNVIKKPAIRLKNGESLAAFQKRVFEEYTKFATEKGYFSRMQIILSTARLDAWLTDTSSLVVELAAKIENKEPHWPMNTGACKAYFGTCQYMPACIAGSYNKLLYMKDPQTK